MKRHTINQQTIEYLGWVGVALVITGYFLVSSGIVAGDEISYHVFMLVGSIFLTVISINKRAHQPALVNIIFALIALYAIIRITLL